LNTVGEFVLAREIAVKTVRFHHIGGPEVLVVEDLPIPSPKANEVLIRVEAVGVNFADVLRRRGDPYPEESPTPFVLGAEIAGTVESVGEGVTTFAPGSFVYAACRTGGYAQYVAVSATAVIEVPAGISAAEATSLVVQGLTAAFALRHSGRLAKGESVLVEAAAGGVGSFAVQLAKLFGAGTVIAAASTEEKRSLAQQLGADCAVDYTQSNWSSKVKELTGDIGVDIILEMTGGPTLTEALNALAPFGRMVLYGRASGETALVDPQSLVVANQSITGFYIGSFFRRPKLVAETLKEIVDYVLAGRLAVQVGTVLPLSQAAEVHRLLEGRHTTGKVVLQPWVE
jgi:NADPH2:quinone reductase